MSSRLQRGISKQNWDIRHQKPWYDDDEFSSVPELSELEQRRQTQVHRYGGQEVEQLTPDSFDEFVRSHPRNMVVFHSPTCGHCRDLEPHYQEAARRLRASRSSTRLAAIDGQAYSDFGQRQGVRGWPTIRSYRSPGQFREYQGPRTPEALVQFARESERESSRRTPMRRSSGSTFGRMASPRRLAYEESMFDFR